MRTLSAAVLLLALAIVPANATTCTQAVAKCRAEGAAKPDIDAKCQAAGAVCMKTGTFVGPILGRVWKNLRRE